MNLRLMTMADIPAGMRLKEVAGWNQTPADWQRFLNWSPRGCFVAESGGRVVGTATTITYGRKVSWIGMVLVDPDYRGQGIGTRLLAKTLEYLDAQRVPSIKLDATPEGRPIYEKLGFVSEYDIERWVLRRSPPTEISNRKPAKPNLYGILKLDPAIFGADRAGLLCSLDREAPAFTLEIGGRGTLQGYALGRQGSRADHLGPWVARDESTARQLLEEFLRRSSRETLFVDCLKSNPFARALVSARAFEFARPLTRMVRGSNAHPGRPKLICAILGPEFG